MNIYNPPHPGELLKEMYLTPISLSITDAAEGLGITRQALSELINGKTGVSIDMARRLAKALDTSPTFWLNLQMQYDLWQTRSKKFPEVRRLVA
ncbi:MAG: addiction module antidote protein, HigA family [Gammaproteobacteria bacterium RIFCSPLOWO2_02_FULL_38_11]|nr:MAG: addiction module antidote protein, HigA family [Gammaproteobacteria bacterium RIFCSPHIGHO2_12_38_15]OGT68120.1 MAG: addiction module antidote protein, HigA family [Gammaproteobacteria bacterium RIFCSPLOWO2_02_FULL_38_11]